MCYVSNWPHKLFGFLYIVPTPPPLPTAKKVCQRACSLCIYLLQHMRILTLFLSLELMKVQKVTGYIQTQQTDLTGPTIFKTTQKKTVWSWLQQPGFKLQTVHREQIVSYFVNRKVSITIFTNYVRHKRWYQNGLRVKFFFCYAKSAKKSTFWLQLAAELVDS